MAIADVKDDGRGRFKDANQFSTSQEPRLTEPLL